MIFNLQTLGRKSAVCLGLLLCLVALGCGSRGPKSYPVTGKVIYDNEAVSGASVLFIPVAGGPYATGHSADDGTYEVKLPAGAYKLAINAMSFPNGVESEGVSTLPSKFGSEQTSGVTAEIKDGPNVVEINLPKDPKFKLPTKKSK
ncbi:carboxypeptidase-like regulatory domain-containing protein [Planctomicrobium sp. SH527]|uniref:carboxypeptidase-like regulatory domain-containing protein n=1 Tax=Planctomicrobium sp. SH527 TaxID=3448123 RepID=UPI003F5C8010